MVQGFMKIIISEELAATLTKIKRKDPSLFEQTRKKINQIAELDEKSFKHFKNLRGDMSDYRRVHVGCHVLLFRLEGDSVIFTQLVHHDDAY